MRPKHIYLNIYCCLFKLSVLTEVLFWCFLCLFHLLDFVFHRFCWIPHSSTFLRVIFQYIPLDSIALDRFECLSQKRVFTCYLEAGIQYIILDSIALDRFNWMFISEKEFSQVIWRDHYSRVWLYFNTLHWIDCLSGGQWRKDLNGFLRKELFCGGDTFYWIALHWIDLSGYLGKELPVREAPLNLASPLFGHCP